MAVDRAKALADYPAFRDNAFTHYLLEVCLSRLDSELKVLATTGELNDIYRAQGRAAVWSSMLRLPDDLVDKLK